MPTLPIAAPVLLAQGGADTLVLPEAQSDYVAGRCAAGKAVDHRTYAGLDHLGLVTGNSALLPERLALDHAAIRRPARGQYLSLSESPLVPSYRRSVVIGYTPPI